MGDRQGQLRCRRVQTGMAGWFCSWLEEGVGAIKIGFSSFLLFTFLPIFSLLDECCGVIT